MVEIDKLDEFVFRTMSLLTYWCYRSMLFSYWCLWRNLKT